MSQEDDIPDSQAQSGSDGSTPVGSQTTLSSNPTIRAKGAKIVHGRRNITFVSSRQSARGATPGASSSPASLSASAHSAKPTRRTKAGPFGGYPKPTAAYATASQLPLATLPRPTLLLNFLGSEIPPDDRDIREQEEIDQTKYPRLAANIQTDGWLPLINASYDDEQTAESTLSKKFSRYQWVYQCDEALAGIHDQVLAAYMTGNPTQMAAGDPQGLGKALHVYSERSAAHASIYVRHLTVGSDHDNLTVDEAMQLALVAKQYANMQSEKWQEARTIDKALYGNQWRTAWSKQGFRALIHNRNGKVSSMKQRVMQTWADALERIARQADKDEQTHIRSLYYVGYSINAQKRKEDHEKMDHSTNDLIRFTNAVLGQSEWFENTPVSISTQAICLLSGENVAAVAEALLARLMCSYHFSGGFNIQPCGASVQSVYRINMSPNDKEALWVGNREWLDKMTDYSEYLKQETQRRTALQRRGWEQEKSELLRRRQESAAKVEEQRKACAEIREQMDWDIADEDDFFKEYIDMFNNLSTAVDNHRQR